MTSVDQNDLAHTKELQSRDITRDSHNFVVELEIIVTNFFIGIAAVGFTFIPKKALVGIWGGLKLNGARRAFLRGSHGSQLM